jgi:hypothetical protein
METYLKSYLEFHMKSRDESFWTTDLLNGMKLELERTMSETLLDKSDTNMAKTDPKSQFNYNSKVSQYFSNKAFEIIIYGPKKTNAKEISESIVTSKLDNNEQPKSLKFDYYPLHVSRDKIDRRYLILKKNKDDNKAIVNGVDCYIKCDENLNELNTVLMQLLLKNGQELKNILVNIPIPNSNLNFGTASCSGENINSYFENYNENV